MTARERLRADRLLVEAGHFESRARARAAIEAGLVSADGAAVRRASDLLARDAAIVAEAPHPYVSRGGLKLAAALDAFGFDPAGRVCLDVGASTGGFTDVLLRRGAARVHAVDVGRGQLHPRLAADARVAALEATDARALDPSLLPEPPGLLVIDVSFIGLRLVLPGLVPLLAPEAALVALIKPQFEAGRERVGRGGLVRDEAVQAEVCAAVRSLVETLGLAVAGLIPSPVEGGDGNREFLIGAVRRGAGA
ncbi:Hemolysin A [Methylobacterium crusticola]|uniref:Hemolysin A n=1 Tax=Methylobacterium crusticola TaxID=1697972 RepID=A0ABQ4QWS1_9HYPH|nr:TlyA family RNA methyltransferase [Methylobacterium crusticola]GJD49637.1 Hemolysin A [Methylobacterium crusticola]